MRRREFISLLGGAAAAWPLAARAQQPAMPVVGHLSVSSPEAQASRVSAFRKGLSETGYVGGRNVAIEYRWAYNEIDRLPELAADLVRRRVVVIAAQGGAAALPAKAATTTIPIVFSTGVDPVQSGLVASLNRPGGNVTGFASMNVELVSKQLGLLHELLPGTTRFAVLVNPNNAVTAESTATEVQAVTRTLGWQIEVLAARTNRDIDAAFATLAQKRVKALVVIPNPLFISRRVQLATLAVKHPIPVIYAARGFTEAGGLMS
jgi:putative ABC transport system substrate-binding protein